MSLSSLFDQLQNDALPGVWSRGVALAREKAVLVDSERADEVILRVKAPGKTVSPRVSVWPEDDDAHCDCGDRVEPCMHIVAAVVGLRNGWVSASAPAPAQTRLVYRFRDRGGALAFERVMILASGKERPLVASLVSHMGGIDSGRIAEASVSATREDFRIDQVVSELARVGSIDREQLHRSAIPALFAALRDAGSVELDGAPVRVQATPLRIEALIEDARSGVRVMFARPLASEGREFSNGAIFANGELRPLHEIAPELLKLAGREIPHAELPDFVSRILPLLEKETRLEIRAKGLPELRAMEPWLQLVTDRDPARPETLEVMARLVYGDPPVAEVIDGRLDMPPGARIVPIRDEARERELEQELRSKLHLKPRQRVSLFGREALEFVERSKALRTAGAAHENFRVRGELRPEIFADSSGLRVSFALPGGGGGRAETDRVLAAWSAGETQVPLADGSGWATIPKAWLNHNVERLEALLAARPHTIVEKLQVAEFCAEAGGTVSPDLAKLREQLVEFKGIPEAWLPHDLTAELRPYQRAGVSWLGFLRGSGLGALLADDMGLGKTLQALCALRGRTLIVAPTSVLPSWESQIRKFRPGLKLNVYAGSSRRLEKSSDVILMSYGILRQDRALITSESWDTIVLDEAQNIKNPGSQITRIAHELKGSFRIALTGTPIENRIDDLWSQVQFIQPGLLGAREDMLRNVTANGLEFLRRKIRPLILRRLKREVARELPEKTETVLYSDLNEEEQKAYRTVFAAVQENVIRELEAGGGVFGALEALLRLRQVCAHPALVPGFEPKEFALSSKLELMREQLEESLALGHSVLIFSQWTSFLDLVEKAIAPLGVDFLRIDGSTQNRGAIIDRFQDPEGPRVMLLSLKAGGTGLTLTKADHVMILDPWWNPAVEDQAADRAHRIGQTQPVLVQRFVARDTVEDRIIRLQAKKRELAEQVLGAPGQAGQDALQLTREELLKLLR